MALCCCQHLHCGFLLTVACIINFYLFSSTPKWKHSLLHKPQKPLVILRQALIMHSAILLRGQRGGSCSVNSKCTSPLLTNSWTLNIRTKPRSHLPSYWFKTETCQVPVSSEMSPRRKIFSAWFCCVFLDNEMPTWWKVNPRWCE